MSEEILQQLINWIALGSIYALLAVGFSLLFGVLGVIHFSHGDISLVAPFVALAILQTALASLSWFGGAADLVLACLIAIAAVGVLGIAIDRFVLRAFRDKPAMMALVTTVALGIVIRELIRHLFPQGGNPHAFPTPLAEPAFALGNVVVSWFTVLDVASATAVLLVLSILLRKTGVGVRIRAVSQDREAARLMGIDANAVFRNTFFIASATGALAGLLYASYVGVTRFDFGILAGLMGFSAAVIGGLGSIPGAVIGGLLLAGVETFAQAAIENGTAYRQVFAFLLVIAFLVFRPAGLFGRTVTEKV
ncbi:branched-chain amino acid ABC transporter permease [Rhodospirillaceae bacterium SYSU D60014]|uniref:branched-chain amino acid ABC transporter permease n=1 Tax=Virgifigura deserti TaxID=2268457 RepID=UPI000E669CFD